VVRPPWSRSTPTPHVRCPAAGLEGAGTTGTTGRAGAAPQPSRGECSFRRWDGDPRGWVREALPGDTAAACVAQGDVVSKALDAEQTVLEVAQREPSTGLHGRPRGRGVVDSQVVWAAAGGAPGLKLSSAGRQSLPPSWITSDRGAGLWCAGGSAVGTAGLAGFCILTAQTELGQHARIAACVARGRTVRSGLVGSVGLPVVRPV
jgi:hypothetical protein